MAQFQTYRTSVAFLFSTDRKGDSYSSPQPLFIGVSMSKKAPSAESRPVPANRLLMHHLPGEKDASLLRIKEPYIMFPRYLVEDVLLRFPEPENVHVYEQSLFSSSVDVIPRAGTLESAPRAPFSDLLTTHRYHGHLPRFWNRQEKRPRTGSSLSAGEEGTRKSRFKASCSSSQTSAMATSGKKSMRISRNKKLAVSANKWLNDQDQGTESDDSLQGPRNR